MSEKEIARIARRKYLKYAGGIVAVAVVAIAGYGIYEAARPAVTSIPTPTSTSTLTPTPSPTPTVAPTITATPTPTPTPFYRLRLRASTTSDWSWVRLTKGARVILNGIIEAKGGFAHKGGNSSIGLTQTIGAARRKESITVVVDFALTNLSSKVEFEITRGDLGETIAEVWNANAEVATKVKTVHWSGKVPPLNTNLFNVETSAITSGGPLTSGLDEITDAEFSLSRKLDKELPPLQPQFARRPELSKMVWASYYLWYRSKDWVSPILKDQPATRYASSDPDALTRHVEQAKAAGIDGFVASWWGPKDYTDTNLKKLLDISAEREFWITAYFETLEQPNLARPESEITRWLEHLLREYGEHPAYYCLNGKPVVVIWASGAVPLAAWQRIFAELRSEGLDAIYLGIGLMDSDALSVFDGLHDYGVAGQFRLGLLYQYAAQQIRGYSLSHIDVSVPKIFVATLQPGYDDRNIPGREGFYWDRRNGDSYRYTFEAAMKSDPDWLFITTWNEWWEHTYIEPSVQYGDLYLRLTKEFADAWKTIH